MNTLTSVDSGQARRPAYASGTVPGPATASRPAACSEGGCEFRLGERWTAERLAGQREPHLRASVARERLELVFAGPGDEAQLLAGLERLRRRVIPLEPDADLPARLHHA